MESDKLDNCLKTPFYGNHHAAGARLVDFAGWAMPLLYSSILEEHAATRDAATIFDVSHMGRLRVSGDLAFKLLDRACTADMLTQEDDTSRYALLCNDSGGILDDLIVMRFDDGWLVVCNASNRLKVVEQLRRVNDEGGYGARIKDVTESTAMAAIQGPAAMETMQRALPFDISTMSRRDALRGTHLMIGYTASRSGYTGEDGLEIVIPAFIASKAWNFITSDAAGVRPAGLGSRDLLRLEAGLPLYGHELSEEIDPITAGLGRAVRRREGFVGFEAIERVREAGPSRRLVGLRLAGRRAARQGAELLCEGRPVGSVTSGAWSPSCQASIAMAYVEAAVADDAPLTVRLNERAEAPAVIVPRPFHRGTAFAKS